MKKLIFTSRGLNTQIGRTLICKAMEEYHHNIDDNTPILTLKRKLDYIYVTEGNTFDILHFIRTAGLVRKIKQSVKNGTVYIGASAGAMLAGTDISFAQDFDRHRQNMTDFTGLQLFNGIIIPHYTETELQNYLSHLSNSMKKKYKHIYHVSNDGIVILEEK
jgi:peptidase E